MLKREYLQKSSWKLALNLERLYGFYALCRKKACVARCQSRSLDSTRSRERGAGNEIEFLISRFL
jgi:hypothetical protein